MSFKKILGKKALIGTGAAITAGLATGLVYFLSKNATMEQIDEVINEKKDDSKIVEVDFQEEKNKEETEKPKEDKKVEVEMEEKEEDNEE